MSLRPTAFQLFIAAPDGHDRSVSNVLFSINPMEQGVEILHVLELTLDDDDYLLDGEILEFGSILARRPVLLLDMEFLRRCFSVSGKIGEDTSLDRRILPDVPPEAAMLFSADVALRRSRVSRLSGAHDLREIEHHQTWLAKYADDVESGRLVSEDMRSVCPVTWKALELIFQHGIV